MKGTRPVDGLQGLATKMMLTRARLLGSRKDEASIQTAVDTAYDYFSRNPETAAADLRVLFG